MVDWYRYLNLRLIVPIPTHDDEDPTQRRFPFRDCFLKLCHLPTYIKLPYKLAI